MSFDDFKLTVCVHVYEEKIFIYSGFVPERQRLKDESRSQRQRLFYISQINNKTSLLKTKPAATSLPSAEDTHIHTSTLSKYNTTVCVLRSLPRLRELVNYFKSRGWLSRFTDSGPPRNSSQISWRNTSTANKHKVHLSALRKTQRDCLRCRDSGGGGGVREWIRLCRLAGLSGSDRISAPYSASDFAAVSSV